MSEVNMKDVIAGLKITLRETQGNLIQGIDDMSTKQLRRALEATVNILAYDESEADRDLTALSQTENKYLGNLVTLIKTNQAYHVYQVGEMQKERLTAENSDKESEE